MTASITEFWVRIETWLAANAPEIHAALAPPATRAAIAAAQESIGRPLPEALVESLLRHDGTDDHVLLPTRASLLSLQEIVDIWTMKIEAASGDEDPDGYRECEDGTYGPWWDPQWIPFAGDGYDYLVIDQGAGRRHGRIGEAMEEDGGYFSHDEIWESLPVLFDKVATALETGGKAGRYRPSLHCDDQPQLEWDQACLQS